MLYRVQPNGRVSWNELSWSFLKDVAGPGVDLDRLEWQDVGEPIQAAEVLAVALRHGIPTGSGLVVESHRVSALRRPATLRQTYAELKKATAHPQIKAMDEVMEQMAPGWIADGERNEAEVEESTNDSIREAEDEAHAVMEAPVRDALVGHWTGLGGVAP